jgi:hypothetical protein
VPQCDLVCVARNLRRVFCVMCDTCAAQGVVRDACQYHRSALRRGVEFAVSISATVPKIFSDGVRVGQV